MKNSALKEMFDPACVRERNICTYFPSEQRVGERGWREGLPGKRDVRNPPPPGPIAPLPPPTPSLLSQIQQNSAPLPLNKTPHTLHTTSTRNIFFFSFGKGGLYPFCSLSQFWWFQKLPNPRRRMKRKKKNFIPQLSRSEPFIFALCVCDGLTYTYLLFSRYSVSYPLSILFVCVFLSITHPLLPKGNPQVSDLSLHSSSCGAILWHSHPRLPSRFPFPFPAPPLSRHPLVASSWYGRRIPFLIWRWGVVRGEVFGLRGFGVRWPGHGFC